PLMIYFKTILSIKWLLLFIVIINLIFQSSLQFTIITLLRLIYIVLYTSILTLTTTPNEITDGLSKFFSPLKLIKIPVNKMALSISLALRFIPLIVDEANKILKSQASRGIDYNNSNLKGKFLALKSLIVPVFILTFKSADSLADVMELRLYNVSAKRVNFRQNKWGFYDTFLVLLHLALFVLIIVKG
ncbi:MAG: energy-coupling factor transporter transmembrane component T, partial [Bacilli bacterium]